MATLLSGAPVRPTAAKAKKIKRPAPAPAKKTQVSSSNGFFRPSEVMPPQKGESLEAYRQYLACYEMYISYLDYSKQSFWQDKQKTKREYKCVIVPRGASDPLASRLGMPDRKFDNDILDLSVVTDVKPKPPAPAKVIKPKVIPANVKKLAKLRRKQRKIVSAKLERLKRLELDTKLAKAKLTYSQVTAKPKAAPTPKKTAKVVKDPKGKGKATAAAEKPPRKSDPKPKKPRKGKKGSKKGPDGGPPPPPPSGGAGPSAGSAGPKPPPPKDSKEPKGSKPPNRKERRAHLQKGASGEQQEAAMQEVLRADAETQTSVVPTPVSMIPVPVKEQQSPKDPAPWSFEISKKNPSYKGQKTSSRIWPPPSKSWQADYSTPGKGRGAPRYTMPGGGTLVMTNVPAAGAPTSLETLKADELRSNSGPSVGEEAPDLEHVIGCPSRLDRKSTVCVCPD